MDEKIEEEVLDNEEQLLGARDNHLQEQENCGTVATAEKPTARVR